MDSRVSWQPLADNLVLKYICARGDKLITVHCICAGGSNLMTLHYICARGARVRVFQFTVQWQFGQAVQGFQTQHSGVCWQYLHFVPSCSTGNIVKVLSVILCACSALHDLLPQDNHTNVCILAVLVLSRKRGTGCIHCFVSADITAVR